ncbi:MAG: endonuclease/exonuclease/phosphatase family protein [Acidobacteriota bacterium]
MKSVRHVVRHTLRWFSAVLALAESYVVYKLFTQRKRRHEPLTPRQLDQVEWGSFFFPPDSSSPDPSDPELRDGTVCVSSWNIQYGRHYERVVEAFKKELSSDIYLIQEVDRACRRSHFRNVAELLASELSLHFVFAIEFQELAQEGSRRPAVHGQAILSRLPVVRAEVLRFNHQPENWSNHPFQPRRGARMAVKAEIQLGQASLIVYNTHLESHGGERGRARQMEEILADVRHHQASPVLIAGDLNTRQGVSSPVIQTAAEHGFSDALSSSAGTRATAGDARLDWVLVRGLEPVWGKTHADVRGSDHRPISTRLRWNPPE